MPTTTTIKLVNNELVLSVVDQKDESSPKYCSLYSFAPHYVLVTGSYDHTFVGPFLSFGQAFSWAQANETNFMTTVMDQPGMEDNIKQYGDCSLCLPDALESSLRSASPIMSDALDTQQLITDLSAVGLKVITFE